MANKKILFVSHKKSQCGVYEFGKNITDVLYNSKKYDFIRVECSSLSELYKFIEENKPDAIIYNYIPTVFPWIINRIAPKIYHNNIASIKVPQIGIIHDVTQNIADNATGYKNKFLFGNYYKLINSLFDFYIAPDPTLLLKNNLVYKTGRLVSLYHNDYLLPLKTTIGSFGFGTPKKGFEKIVELTQQTFDEAIIRFNIPFADFGDKNGARSIKIEDNCRKLIIKPGIELVITHDFLDARGILDFLAKNTVNVFLYEDTIARGLSSAVDHALSVHRPIAVSNSIMFRHILNASPSVCVTENNLNTIIKNGFSPLQKYHDEWNADNLLWDYERIMNKIFCSPVEKKSIKFQKNFYIFLKSTIYRLLSLPNVNFTWLRNSDRVTEDNMKINYSIKYIPVKLPENFSLNRILDNSSRELYAPAIDKIKELVPKTMAKKIPEANVQQAYVFDTVYRHLSKYVNPKLLCIGSYEDTASMSLIKMGVPVEEIDPTQNYYLQEYVSKPSTVKNSYDIIFSTSVIEHDSDDESFMRAIDNLLAPGGMAIITCDYKDGWKFGDIKPDVDVRFYTKYDLENRLLSYMNNCELVDKPKWDCPNPDFYFLDRYNYTFATFVIRKNVKTND